MNTEAQQALRFLFLWRLPKKIDVYWAPTLPLKIMGLQIPWNITTLQCVLWCLRTWVCLVRPHLSSLHCLRLMSNEALTLLPGSCSSWVWVLTSGQCARTGTPWRKDAGSSWRGSPPPPPSCRKMEAIITSIISCVVRLGQKNVLSQRGKREGGAEQWISVGAWLMTEVWSGKASAPTITFKFVKHLAETVTWHITEVPADSSLMTWRNVSSVQNHSWLSPIVKDKAGDTPDFSSCQQSPKATMNWSIFSGLFWLNPTDNAP